VTIYLLNRRDFEYVQLQEALDNAFHVTLSPEEFIPNDMNHYYEEQLGLRASNTKRKSSEVIIRSEMKCEMLVSPYVMFVKIQRVQARCKLMIPSDGIVHIKSFYDGRQQYRVVGIVSVANAHYSSFVYWNQSWHFFDGLGGELTRIPDISKNERAVSDSILLLFSRM
jgi:hypothetical protein